MIAKVRSRGICCSFCGKAKGEVANIVAGTPQRRPGVPRRMIGKSAFICDECVHHYYEMVERAELSLVPVNKDLTL